MDDEMNFQADQRPLMDALERARKETDEVVKISIIKSAIDQVRDKLSDVIISQMPTDVSVKNLDEVKLHLRNELAKAITPVLQEMKKMKISSDNIKSLKLENERKIASMFNDNFDFVVLRKPKTTYRIENLDEIVFPKDLRVNNLQDLAKYFEALSKVIRETFSVKVPTPECTVNVPETIIPAPVVNVEPPNLDELLSALKPLRFLSNKATTPLSVRLSNGTKFENLVKAVLEKQSQVVVAASRSMDKDEFIDAYKSINNPQSTGDGRKTVTNAGTAVQFSSQACKYVIITAETDNTDVVVIGGSTVVAALATRRGFPLYPAQNIRLEITNMNQLWIDAMVDTEGVTYAWFA